MIGVRYVAYGCAFFIGLETHNALVKAQTTQWFVAIELIVMRWSHMQNYSFLRAALCQKRTMNSCKSDSQLAFHKLEFFRVIHRIYNSLLVKHCQRRIPDQEPRGQSEVATKKRTVKLRNKLIFAFRWRHVA